MDERESNLFDRFYKSWRGIEVAYEKIASDCGVTTNVMYILTLLYKNCEPMTQNELSKELHLSKQTVTSVVDSLEKRGWVTRSIDPNDRRNRIVTLTESGRETGRHIGRTMRRAEFSAFGRGEAQSGQQYGKAVGWVCTPLGIGCGIHAIFYRHDEVPVHYLLLIGRARINNFYIQWIFFPLDVFHFYAFDAYSAKAGS